MFDSLVYPLTADLQSLLPPGAIITAKAFSLAFPECNLLRPQQAVPFVGRTVGSCWAEKGDLSHVIKGRCNSAHMLRLQSLQQQSGKRSPESAVGRTEIYPKQIV